MGDTNSASAGAAKRPFWMHQLVEYILGGALVASGMQSPTPIAPAVVGGLLLLYAASTRGALSAFRLIDRRWHRLLDPLFVALEAVAAVQPWIETEPGARFVLGGIAVVHAVVWWGSTYTERAPRVDRRAAAQAAVQAALDPEARPDRSTELGRSAGRMVGSGVKAVRRARAARSK